MDSKNHELHLTIKKSLHRLWLLLQKLSPLTVLISLMIGLLFYLVVVSGDEISSQASILNNIDNHGHQLILKWIIIEKLENSTFYHVLLDQVQTPHMLEAFFRVLGSELKMHMVVYGIGSIESYEPPQL